MRSSGFVHRIAQLALIAFVILGAGALSAQDSARLQGTLLAPDGTPAVGFRAVLVDIVGGEEQISELSDELGEYLLDVEAGTRYRILAVISPEGDRLPVLPHAPMPVRVPGTYRLPDITFMTGMTNPGADSGEIEALPAAGNEDDNRSPLVPWYRKPGAIVGWVAGGLAVIALAAGGGSEDPVSPFAAPTATVDPLLPD
jgi:hypothetical protein